jgi:E3 ubiquitin-protein ligase CHFR
MIHGENTCPSCRGSVEYVARNHTINNFVESYLKKHPNKQRSKEEIDEIEKSNKITDEFVIFI